MSPQPQSPGWVEKRFGVQLDGDAFVHGSLQLALRRNPRRAHLLVSGVLGKHIPADPDEVHGAGLQLGRLVAEVLGDDGSDALVLGFAETATALGHCVAEALGAQYLHSTRRAVPGAVAAGGFQEEHSHATSHQLVPEDPELLTSARAVVLVDDELSTGRTALNTIRALHRGGSRRYVLAALVDLRSVADQRAVRSLAEELGVEIEAVALGHGSVGWPTEFPQQAAQLVGTAAAVDDASPSGQVVEHRAVWPLGVRDGGRHGFGPSDVRRAQQAAEAVATELHPALTGRTLVLGTEELMYAPVLIASALKRAGADVLVSSSTRSPVHVVDEDGYPIRSMIVYQAGEDAADGPGLRFAYNVRGFDEVVVVTDVGQPGLVEALRRVCGRVHVVRLPSHRPSPPPLSGPGFGSYAADEVSWLLTDLSEVTLEAPTEEREEAVQSGGAHYAESLPVEFRPDAAYRALFEQALDESAGRIAHAVGLVTELILAERGPCPVLVSLARAGTPVGILLRRWARFAHGVELPHHAVSIVRGRGIDVEAMRWLATRYEPARVVFVDGWTGKGAIARELHAAIDSLNEQWSTAFDPSLAVLADPGRCVSTFGTREDFLIPSACLNSTVSGLVSRTVLNDRVLRPGQFHGAKFYRDLAGEDVSATFLDAVTDRFADVASEVVRDLPVLAAGERGVSWAGWAEVEKLSAEYGIGDVTLVKPGVGETTRVLLRRVPWAVLARPDAGGDLAHVRLLAHQRGVPVYDVPDLTYSCVGLIHPRYTRGATGGDGRTAVRS